MTLEDKLEEGLKYAEKQFNDSGEGTVLLDMLQQLSSQDEVRILDFGCGFGGRTLWYSKFENCRVYGLDVDSNHIAVANQLKDKLGRKNVVFENRNILNDPLKKDEIFDLVTFHDVIEHIPIDILTSILEQISQNLSDRGLIYFGYPPWQSPYAAHVYSAVKIPWIQYLPDKTTRKLIEKNNKEIVGEIESDLIQVYNGLNRITHKKILQICKKLGLSPINRKSHCILNKLAPFKNLNFDFFPFKYLITYEILVLTKNGTN